MNWNRLQFSPSRNENNVKRKHLMSIKETSTSRKKAQMDEINLTFDKIE
jgi:hypothetical protein